MHIQTIIYISQLRIEGLQSCILLLCLLYDIPLDAKSFGSILETPIQSYSIN
jgi:hypothetical protein